MKTFLKMTLLALLVGVNAAESVKVSDFKPSRENATKAVQAALDSGAKQVIFDNPGFEYLVEPLWLRSNQELVFEDKVQVRALPGAFKGRNDSLFTGKGVENVMIRGTGTAVLSMNKSDYQDAARYRPAEWRHTISLLACRNITVRKLTVKSSGGDGIYVSTGTNFGKPEGCRDILLEDLILDDHHRQGISVISAENLMIRNCRISNTSGTQPMCGIDFEPNQKPGEQLINCVVENCDFINNARAGIIVYTGGLAEPLDITVRNCRFSGNDGIMITADCREATPNRGIIQLESCEFSDLLRPIIIRNHRSGVKLNLTNCKIDNLSGKALLPINIYTEYADDCGGIDFGRLVIHQDPKRQVMSFNGSKGAGLEVPGGEIIITSKDGKDQNFDLKKFAARHKPDPVLKNFQTNQLLVGSWKPANAQGKSGNKFTVRGKGIDFVQYADGTNPVELRFREAWKSQKAAKIAIPVEIFDPAGTPHGKFVVDQEDFTYRFAPNNAGVYRFIINTQGRGMNIDSSAPGFGFGASRRLELFRCAGTFYFQVPAGQEDICVELWGDPPSERASGELLDAKGKVVAKAPHQAGAQVLKAKRTNSREAEIWAFRIIKTDEDWGLRLGAPLPPVLYTAPENLLITK